MQLILDVIPPRQYKRVHAAFLAAGALPGTDDAPCWKLGICNDDGELAAQGELPSFERVQMFLRLMERIGYEPLILGTPEQMHGCDFLFNCQVVVPH
jgi:hypothetical protein